MKSSNNINYGTKNWDAYFAVPTFDFYFKVALPKANKERIIAERDCFLGRILYSRLTHIDSQIF